MADIVAEELPREEDTTYMIAPAPSTATQSLQGSGITDSVVVFCIDTSGSMGVTTEVGITHVLRLKYIFLVLVILILCVDHRFQETLT